MRVRTFVKLLIGFPLIALLCAGCWDVTPIEDRALALMIGLDKNGPQYQISYQIPTIANLSQTNNWQGQHDPAAFRPFVKTGTSVAEISQQIEDENYRTLISGSVKVIVISRPLAANGLIRALSAFLRQPMVSSQTLLLMADRPEEIIKQQPPFELQPALILGKQLRSPLKRARTYPMELWDFVARADNQYPDPFLPIVRIDRATGSYLLEGLGIFRNDKLVGDLNPYETYLFGILSGRAKKALAEVRLGKESFMLHNIFHQTRIRVLTVGRRRILQVKVKIKGSFIDLPERLCTDNPRDLQLLKETAQRQFGAELTALIQKLQSLAADPVGFSSKLVIAGVSDWRAVFRSIPVKVTVDMDFRYSPPSR